MREHSIDYSESLVLDCRCGETLILYGREDDWYSRNAIFVCSECKEKLTLDDRIDQEAFGNEGQVRDLMTTHSL